MKYTVCVWWSVGADIQVEAESFEEAMKKAKDADELPDDGEYIDGSFTVNVEATEAVNEPYDGV